MRVFAPLALAFSLLVSVNGQAAPAAKPADKPLPRDYLEYLFWAVPQAQWVTGFGDVARQFNATDENAIAPLFDRVWYQLWRTSFAFYGAGAVDQGYIPSKSKASRAELELDSTYGALFSRMMDEEPEDDDGLDDDDDSEEPSTLDILARAAPPPIKKQPFSDEISSAIGNKSATILPSARNFSRTMIRYKSRFNVTERSVIIKYHRYFTRNYNIYINKTIAVIRPADAVKVRAAQKLIRQTFVDTIKAYRAK
ncbi:hypothetical protein BOTBODRAFT_67407 [Botryobasidium botryosum FD-172 SS1]|uniref:Uncharacterized protein n=1 Tax=Botryobasidium botryosum (strain FD-172 SS1) TaxID=930990 RepID=A0A067MAB5_BOTB1|nr:hypothetical protein BOTBODRAFT_67407 [Botryobasidium botryosum FD-172 SS1]